MLVPWRVDLLVIWPIRSFFVFGLLYRGDALLICAGTLAFGTSAKHLGFLFVSGFKASSEIEIEMVASFRS